MAALLIQGARIVDPATGLDAVCSLLASDGSVVGRQTTLTMEEAAMRLPAPGPMDIVDAAGLWLLPGLVDPHVHFRDPGFTAKEDLQTGGLAAAAGGYTSVICEPNTQPPLDSPPAIMDLCERAERECAVRLYAKAAMTVGRLGAEPTDVRALAEEKEVVALSDDGDPVVDPAVMEEVCRRAAEADLPVAPHCEDSTRALEAVAAGADCGFARGEPYANEAGYIARDAEIAVRTWCRIHFSHVSLAASLEAIEQHRPLARLTYEVTPHHLLLCREDYAREADVPTVNPPVRSGADREELRRALVSGRADAVASDHAPHTAADKAAGACGLVGLETTLALMLTHFVERGDLSMVGLVRVLSLGPARVFRLPAGSLAPGSPADMVLVDPEREWVVDPKAFLSKSRNSPFAGWRLRGKAVATYVGGRAVWQDGDFSARVRSI